LKLTAKAAKNGWLEYDRFLLAKGLFSGAFAVSFREGNISSPTNPQQTTVWAPFFIAQVVF